MTRVKITDNGVNIEPTFKKGGGKKGRINTSSTSLGRSVKIHFPETRFISLTFNRNSLIKHLNVQNDYPNARGSKLKSGWIFGIGGSSKDKIENTYLATYQRFEDLHTKGVNLEVNNIKQALKAYRLAADNGHPESIQRLQELNEKI